MKTKRLISLILAVILSLGTVVYTASASEASASTNADILLGDVNDDGTVDTKDIILLRQYFANYNYDTGKAPFEIGDSADVNGDGEINSTDIVELRDILVNKVYPDDEDSKIGETIDAEYAADFTVAKVFSDNMVVQRNEQIRVWGFAPESENGKKVSATFKGMFAEALVENGEWCITFGARLVENVNGAQMKIYTDTKTVAFENVLVGDVYLVMGQSNAAYNVEQHLKYDDPATQGGGLDAIDENSIIRLNYLNGSGGEYSKKGTDYVYSDLENTTFWTKTTQNDTKRFSALGYYFARHMTEKDPTVPIGLMEVAVGGAPLVSFLPNDLAEKWDGDYLNTADGKYYSNVSNEHMGRYFYNCYLAPVSRYAIAGVLWYQGESNNGISESMKYNATFADFMTRLRSTHNVTNKDFPVFITELPSIYQKPADSTATTWYYMELGMIRATMGAIPTVLDNSYVSASGDLWNDRTFYNNLHPNCKYEQSERLAAIADVIVNKNGTLDAATGPIFESAVISADKKSAVITFSNVGEGLTTIDGGTEVLGIKGLRADKPGQITVNATSATITASNQITVTFDTEVKAVAYNCISADYYGETLNLCNSYGCPATAFLSSYTELEIGTYKSEDFVTTSHSSLTYKSKSIDTLTANGSNVFEVGKVTSGLAAAGNRIELPQGTERLSTAGWTGFYDQEITMFGYSIDGGDAIFNTYPSEAGDAVIKAGGSQAKRFSVHMNIGSLSAGDHTIDVLVLVDVDGGVAVKFLSFTLTITRQYKAEDFVPTTDSSVNFKGFAIDTLKADGKEIFQTGYVSDFLKSTDYRASVSKGTSRIATSGWAGFTGYDILKFGYSIDGGNAVFNSTPNSVSQAVINAGGEKAKGYGINIDISALEAGDHQVYLLALVDVDGGVAVKLLGFTLAIIDDYTNDDFKPTTDASVNYKGASLDSITAEGGTKSGTTITIPQGTSVVKASGWAGFTDHEIIMFGYGIDGGNAIFNTYPSDAEAGVLNAGGAYAKRFTVSINTADLAVGDHPVYILALVDVDGTRVAVKLVKITIVVTESATE